MSSPNDTTLPPFPSDSEGHAHAEMPADSASGESAQIGLLRIDKSGEVTDATQEADFLLGLPSGAASGKKITDLGLSVASSTGEGTTVSSLADIGLATGANRSGLVNLPDGGRRLLDLRILSLAGSDDCWLVLMDRTPVYVGLRVQKLAALLRRFAAVPSAFDEPGGIGRLLTDFFDAGLCYLWNWTDTDRIVEGRFSLLFHKFHAPAGLAESLKNAASDVIDEENSRRIQTTGVFAKRVVVGISWDFLLLRLPAVLDDPQILILAKEHSGGGWTREDLRVLEENAELISSILERGIRHRESTAGGAYLETILQSVDLGIIFLEKNHDSQRVALANVQFCEFFGTTPALLLGKPAFEIERLVIDSIATPESPQNPSTPALAYFRGDAYEAGELDVVRPSERVLRVYASPSMIGDELVGRLILFRDVTRDKEVERQLLHSQKMESIGTLAGGIAHDFNNLLTSMLGYAELLKIELGNNHPQFQRVEQLEKSARRAAELTNNLLAFSRRTLTQMTVFDVSALVQETTGLIRLSVPQTILLELSLAENLPCVEADETQIQQVLINLIINARDALRMEKGRITITTGLHEEPSQDNSSPPVSHVLIEVEDDGEGIPRESLNRIFEPFYTTKEVGKGTGLGLSMVYGIIKQHNGYIEVTTAPGQGSRFSVYLPATSKTPTRKPVKPRRDTSQPAGRSRILVVDDEPDLLDFCKTALKPICEDVTCASDGIEALAILNATPQSFDLVVLDLTMPRMGGVECFQRIRETAPDLRVILSSGYSIEGGPADLLRKGAVGFLHKPYSIDALVNAVRAQLSRTDSGMGITPRPPKVS